MQEQAQPRFMHVGTGQVRLHVAEAGKTGNPLLFLLHGFPDYWFGWRNQISHLADAGYHVIAPDQRGYNLSDKPSRAAAYSLERLAGDILALADRFGAERFYVAGHDWGAMVGWWLAIHAPLRVRKLMAISAGHPAVWKTRMRHDREQRRLSRYVRFFQIPALPEAILRSRNYAALSMAISRTAEDNAVGAEDLLHYRDAWAQPGALTAMLNWYRAFAGQSFRAPAASRIQVPVELIWGGKDPYGTTDLAAESIAHCEQGRVVVFDKATHWVMIDEPKRLLRHMTEFFDE